MPVDLTSERQVAREIPVALTTQTWGGTPYYETSARKDLNVAPVFEDVLRQIVRQESVYGRPKRASKNGHQGRFKCIIL